MKCLDSGQPGFPCCNAGSHLETLHGFWGEKRALGCDSSTQLSIPASGGDESPCSSSVLTPAGPDSASPPLAQQPRAAPRAWGQPLGMLSFGAGTDHINPCPIPASTATTPGPSEPAQPALFAHAYSWLCLSATIPSESVHPWSHLLWQNSDVVPQPWPKRADVQRDLVQGSWGAPAPPSYPPAAGSTRT